MMLYVILLYFLIQHLAISLNLAKEVCWSEGFTSDYCCSASPQYRSDCWTGHLSYDECCPNASCWPKGAGYSYEDCCLHSDIHNEIKTEIKTINPIKWSNPICWNDIFTYEKCCTSDHQGFSWNSRAFRHQFEDEIYSLSEFYNDAQYGNIFGYYSKGRVISKNKIKIGITEVFSQYTTYPMALSPHFGNVICRKIYRMWLDALLPSYFPIVEMGAGSGQLAVDIQKCITRNILKIKKNLYRRFMDSIDYIILEFSESLVLHQRSRGLSVVQTDAQLNSSCASVQNMFRYPSLVESGVVLSNELLDAFDPMKLRMSLDFDDFEDCDNWSEVLLIHIVSSKDLDFLYRELDIQNISDKLINLIIITENVSCGFLSQGLPSAVIPILSESLGYPWNTWDGMRFNYEINNYEINSSMMCLSVVIALSSINENENNQITLPGSIHNAQLALRIDPILRNYFIKEVENILLSFINSNDINDSPIIILRSHYRDLRNLTIENIPLQIELVKMTKTYKIYVHVRNCTSLNAWLNRHNKDMNEEVSSIIKSLGRSSIQVSHRKGEEEYIALAHCIFQGKGYILTIDYGSSFTSNSNSLSMGLSGDGLAVPPMPLSSILEGLPDECQSIWYRCPGFVDLTSFVDFTNVALSAKELGYDVLLYGPQNFLEGVEYGYDNNNNTFNTIFSFPYLIGEYMDPTNRHVRAWYGNEENLASPRFTSFKAMILKRPVDYLKLIINHSNWHRYLKLYEREFLVNENKKSWHLRREDMDPIWKIDVTEFPQADLLRREGREGLVGYHSGKLMIQYSEEYENLQLKEQLRGHPSKMHIWENVWGKDRVRLVDVN